MKGGDGLLELKSEKWQGIDNRIIHDNVKAIIADDEITDKKKLSDDLAKNGKPIDEVRQKMIRKTVRQNVETDPTKVSAWFNDKYDNTNADKAEKLINDKPVRQFNQVKNEISFFGESFLEGFLGFYGLEVDNAVDRYESKLHVIETQDLILNDEPQYFIGQSKKGELKKATSNMPSREIAEAELQKFNSQKIEQKQEVTMSIEKPDEEDE